MVQGWRNDFESGGARSLSSKKVVVPGLGFTLFPPKSGGAQAQPAHTLPPGLKYVLEEDSPFRRLVVRIQMQFGLY